MHANSQKATHCSEKRQKNIKQCSDVFTLKFEHDFHSRTFFVPLVTIFVRFRTKFVPLETIFAFDSTPRTTTTTKLL